MNPFRDISSRRLYLLSILYLYIPMAIFLCSWVKPWYGIPAAILLGIAIFRSAGVIPIKKISYNSRRLKIATAILTIWVILSGIGGFVWQNRWDHLFRNAVFIDLVNYEWPVSDGSSVLTYYIGFWLPSALLAKVTGCIIIGWISQLLYAIAGILLAFRLCIEKMGNLKLIYLLPFILFSGVDILAFPISDATPRLDHHIEIWSSLAAWESNTTLLFWVYNQAIPAWVATMLMINYGKERSIAALTIGCLTISAPFPAIGLFPLGIYYILAGSFKNRKPAEIINHILSAGNIISIIATIPVILYMSLNHQTSVRIGFIDHTPTEWILAFLLITIAEILIFIPFIYKQIRKSPEFLILFFTSAIGLLFMIGETSDFNSRLELPLNYYITLQLMIYLSGWRKISSYVKSAFVIIALAASVTPLIEIQRTINMSIHLPRTTYRNASLQSIFKENPCRSNFVADSVLNDSANQSRLYLFNYAHEE